MNVLGSTKPVKKAPAKQEKREKTERKSFFKDTKKQTKDNDTESEDD